jgi:hypothetical protein
MPIQNYDPSPSAAIGSDEAGVAFGSSRETLRKLAAATAAPQGQFHAALTFCQGAT